MQIRFPQIDGLELMRPPVSYAQRTRPVSAWTAKRRPSVTPKYAIPSTTTGDDSTLALVSSRHTGRPLRRPRAVTEPSCELTIRRLPAIAGVDALGPDFQVQRILPVSATRATVRPSNVFW